MFPGMCSNIPRSGFLELFICQHGGIQAGLWMRLVSPEISSLRSSMSMGSEILSEGLPVMMVQMMKE